MTNEEFQNEAQKEARQVIDSLHSVVRDPRLSATQVDAVINTIGFIIKTTGVPANPVRD